MTPPGRLMTHKLSYTAAFVSPESLTKDSFKSNDKDFPYIQHLCREELNCLIYFWEQYGSERDYSGEIKLWTIKYNMQVKQPKGCVSTATSTNPSFMTSETHLS